MTALYRKLVITLIALVSATILLWISNILMVGRTIDVYRNVQVFDNGLLYFRSYGRHHANDGYYFGQKWQCVEFIKRFYFQTRKHRMPDVWGHAKDYFDPAVAHRTVNPRRGMMQFFNGGDEPPMPDDLLVFRDTNFGHVAIISSVTADTVEVVRQNIIGRPRQKFSLTRLNGSFLISTPSYPAGWMRMVASHTPNAPHNSP